MLTQLLGIFCLSFTALYAQNLSTYQKEVERWPSSTVLQKRLPKRYQEAYNQAKRLQHYQTEPRIPKIIHQIWLGSPVPQQFYPLIETWKTLHPDWEYKLWTDNDIEEFDLTNKLIYAIAPNYGMKSDIARLEILYRHGGLYIDLDQECLLPHDIFHHITDFYVGIVSPNPSFEKSLANGLIGSCKQHPILKQAIDRILYSYRAIRTIHKQSIEKTLEYTGPFLLSRIVNQYMMQSQEFINSGPLCLVLPKSFFFHLNVNQEI